MIIRELPKMILISAERVQRGDIVRGRQVDNGYHIYMDADVFTVTSARPRLASGAHIWRIDGDMANGDSTWILADWCDAILIEDRRK